MMSIRMTNLISKNLLVGIFSDFRMVDTADALHLQCKIVKI